MKKEDSTNRADLKKFNYKQLYIGLFVFIFLLLSIFGGTRVSINEAAGVESRSLTGLLETNFSHSRIVEFYDSNGLKVADLHHFIGVNVSEAQDGFTFYQILDFQSILISTIREKDVPLIKSISFTFGLEPDLLVRETPQVAQSVGKFTIGTADPTLILHSGDRYEFPIVEVANEFAGFFEAIAQVSYLEVQLKTHFGNSFAISSQSLPLIQIDLIDLISSNPEPYIIDLANFFVSSAGDYNWSAVVILISYFILILYLMFRESLYIQNEWTRLEFSLKQFFNEIWSTIKFDKTDEKQQSFESKQLISLFIRNLMIYNIFTTLMYYLYLIVTTNYLPASFSVIPNLIILALISLIWIILEIRTRVLIRENDKLLKYKVKHIFDTKLFSIITTLPLLALSLIFGVSYFELISLFRYSPV